MLRFAAPTAMHPADTILAIASPPGRSLRGIIRTSGPQTFELLHQCTSTMPQQPTRSVHPTTLRISNRQHISALAFLAPAPHSYTGEDSAELQLPGNPALLERVANAILALAKQHNIDARFAEGGEFTARAFFNGKLTLTQAEGVAATIAAVSDAELRAAQMLRSGSLGAFAHHVADDLAAALALVEAGIDFTDQEDVVAISPSDLYERLIDLRQRITQQLERSVGMEQLEAIPWVVLVGQPNAGKSALFNALLGHERAVVSPTAGTTRDVLAEPLTISTSHGPAEVMLVDLAGLDIEESLINRLMQRAAHEAIARAELILRCVPVDQVQDADEVGNLKDNELLVWTKADVRDPSHAHVHTIKSDADMDRSVTVSTRTGEGLDALRKAIAQRLADRAVSLAADTAALRPRHEAALRNALENLTEAIALVEPVRHEHALQDPELIASSMRSALDELAALAGDITPDDVLGRIFATFCVGK